MPTTGASEFKTRGQGAQAPYSFSTDVYAQWSQTAWRNRHSSTYYRIPSLPVISNSFLVSGG